MLKKHELIEEINELLDSMSPEEYGFDVGDLVRMKQSKKIFGPNDLFIVERFVHDYGVRRATLVRLIGQPGQINNLYEPTFFEKA